MSNSTGNMITCAQCPFTTLTQKGLTIHLRKMHHIVSHNRKPRTNQNRRQSIRLANCSMSAKSWGLPFVCVICGIRTIEKNDLKMHFERDHMNSLEQRISTFLELRREPHAPCIAVQQGMEESIKSPEGTIVGYRRRPIPVSDVPPGYTCVGEFETRQLETRVFHQEAAINDDTLAM